MMMLPRAQARGRCRDCHHLGHERYCGAAPPLCGRATEEREKGVICPAGRSFDPFEAFAFGPRTSRKMLWISRAKVA